VTYVESPPPAFLFDLDGTLIDSVYQHVIAWRAALSAIGIDLSVWRIHRRIGMSGGLFVSALLRETGRSLSKADIDRLQLAHAEQYRAQMDTVTPLPGATDLLGFLTDAGVPWAIATSGYAATARPALGLLGLPEDTPMVTRGTRSSSGTASGTCSRRGGPGRSGSGCCPAGTAGKSSSGPGRTGSTPTRPRCWPGSTSSGCGPRRASG